jgi:hypothetical protein
VGSGKGPRKENAKEDPDRYRSQRLETGFLPALLCLFAYFVY